MKFMQTSIPKTIEQSQTTIKNIHRILSKWVGELSNLNLKGTFKSKFKRKSKIEVSKELSNRDSKGTYKTAF